MTKQNSKCKGLTIANIVFSIICGLVAIVSALMASIFQNTETAASILGFFVTNIYQFILLVIQIVWIIITFILLAKEHGNDEGLGAKTCTIFYGIAGGLVCFTAIGFIASLIILGLVPSIDFNMWTRAIVAINAVSAATLIASFIFSIINVKKM